jgi:putative methyltransferase (TIGR04325 family)
MNATKVAKDWLPPVMQRLVRKLVVKENEAIKFKGDYTTWEEAKKHCSGYDDKEILAKVLNATLKVKDGEAACERDSMLFDEIQYSWPVLAGLMWAAARNGGRLNVLDFGGALGSSYFQNRKFLNTLVGVRWNVVEQAHYVEAGRAHIQDHVIRFYGDIQECLNVNKINTALISGSLQFIPKYEEVLEDINSSDAEYMILDRTPLSCEKEDKIVVQSVGPDIYEASYPALVFSKEKLIKIISGHWNLIEKFRGNDGEFTSNRGLRFSFYGMVFERRL